MIRFCALCLVLALTVPALAQTTGAPGNNDFTINGTGSGATSMVATNVGGSLSMEISGMPGAAVIGAISAAAPGGTPLGPNNSIDVNLVGAQFFIDGTGGFVASALNAFAFTDAGGNFTLAINGGLPAGPIGAIQFGLVGPGYPAPAQTTQAHDVTVVVPACSAQATNTGAGDDTSALVPFTSPFTFYGVAYTDCYANSNGNVTFGLGDADFTSSEGELLSGSPRIATCWDDFSPNIAGSVTYGESAGIMTVSWSGVPHFAAPAGDSNNFCCTMNLVTGDVTISHDSMDLNGGGSVDQIIGICPGGALSLANNVDLSTASGAPIAAVNATDALYEDFFQALNGAYDLSTTTLTFLPGGGAGTGPYIVQ